MTYILNQLLYFGSINSKDTQKIKSDATNGSSYYSAGETPISGEPGVETMGLAVFNGDKFVGELNGFESICHLLVSNKLKNAQIRIPSTIEQLDYIDLYIELDKDTQNSVYLVNSSPYITVNIKVSAKLQSINSNMNLEDKNLVRKIEQTAKSFLEKHVTDYLYKTSKEFYADIDSFGLFALKYFTNTQEWQDYNWLHHYKDAFFDVNVDVDLRSSYLFVNTSDEKNGE